MMEIINKNDDIKKAYTKINIVIGVGMQTAIKCIIETDNFTKFKDGRKFSCHCCIKNICCC